MRPTQLLIQRVPEVLSLGVKCDADHSSLSSDEVKNKQELYFLSLLCLHGIAGQLNNQIYHNIASPSGHAV
jgi:hypothetical protein